MCKKSWKTSDIKGKITKDPVMSNAINNIGDARACKHPYKIYPTSEENVIVKCDPKNGAWRFSKRAGCYLSLFRLCDFTILSVCDPQHNERLTELTGGKIYGNVDKLPASNDGASRRQYDAPVVGDCKQGFTLVCRGDEYTKETWFEVEYTDCSW